MADPSGDEHLVDFYDADNPAGRDHEYYRELDDTLGARRIIGLGYGTGLLTRTFTAPGREVTAVDPSRTMLGHERRQQGADQVRWVEGDALALEPAAAADLLIC